MRVRQYPALSGLRANWWIIYTQAEGPPIPYGGPLALGFAIPPLAGLWFMPYLALNLPAGESRSAHGGRTRRAGCPSAERPSTDDHKSRTSPQSGIH